MTDDRTAGEQERERGHRRETCNAFCGPPTRECGDGAHGAPERGVHHIAVATPSFDDTVAAQPISCREVLTLSIFGTPARRFG
jgi:hypothetical protein